MIKFTYSINNSGTRQHVEFKENVEMIPFTASLMVKRMGGQKIFIHSYTGPMNLGKILYMNLTEPV